MARQTINAVVEGDLDEAVVQKLVEYAGGQLGEVHVKNGKSNIQQKIEGYNRAACHGLWIVLVDLDADEDCAVLLRNAWLPNPVPSLCFRIAVREVEAWLIADTETLARYLSVAQGRVPHEPERLEYPKDTMVNLARRSRRKAIREGMTPRENSGRLIGSTYTSDLIEYVRTEWRPAVAAGRSDSLQRAIRCLRRLTEIRP